MENEVILKSKIARVRKKNWEVFVEWKKNSDEWESNHGKYLCREGINSGQL